MAESESEVLESSGVSPDAKPVPKFPQSLSRARSRWSYLSGPCDTARHFACVRLYGTERKPVECSCGCHVAQAPLFGGDPSEAS